MPTEGIHGTFTGTENPERLESKCAIRCSEKTNVSRAMTSAKARIALNVLPIEEKQQNRAQRRRERDDRQNVDVSSSTSLSPQKPGDDQNAAEKNPAGIGPDISGLHVTQDRPPATRTALPTPLTVPSIMATSTNFHRNSRDVATMGQTMIAS